MNAIVSQENTAIADAVTAPFKIDAMKGSRDGRVSSQWFSRPDDQRYTSLNDLFQATYSRAQAAVQRVVDVNSIRVLANRDDPDTMLIDVDGTEISPTHWSFGQMAGLVGAPAGYLRKLPAPLAAINLQHGISSVREESIKAYWDGENLDLRAATGPEYGRVFDYELVRAVQRIAGNGTGDTRWKIPGMIDWASSMYNPFVDPTKDTTTLYASDRDVFMFLVDDTHPIEIGKLADGSPDLVFRGFYAWNSEVGSKTLGISTFLLRGVCQNRNLWGVQDKSELKLRHSKHVSHRMAHELEPALLEYTNASDRGVILGIQKAKEAIVANTDEDRLEFLGKRGFNKAQAQSVVDTVLREEGKAPESVWDFVNGITATARSIKHQDARLDFERLAGKLMTDATK